VLLKIAAKLLQMVTIDNFKKSPALYLMIPWYHRRSLRLTA